MNTDSTISLEGWIEYEWRCHPDSEIGKLLMALYEPERENIEDRLDWFDEETQSWKSFVYYAVSEHFRYGPQFAPALEWLSGELDCDIT